MANVNGMGSSSSGAVRNAARRSVSAARSRPNVMLPVNIGAVAVDSIVLSGAGTVVAGKTLQLQVAVSPDDATNATVTYDVNSPENGTVDSSNVFHGKVAGTATVTAQSGSTKSNAIEIVVTSDLKLTKDLPATQAETAGANITLEVDAASTIGGYTYSWGKNAATLTGQTTNKVVLSNVGVNQNGDSYQCVVKDASGATVTSTTCKLQITAAAAG